MTKLVNNVKTAVLLGALFGIILVAGRLLGGYHGLIIAFILGGMMNIGAFFFSDKIAITAMRGQEVDEKSAPDLIHMVHRLAQNAGLPMPRVYVCPQEAPNAFATGRSPRHAAVAITHGAMQLLSYDELEGVLGHELAHVKNHDTLTSTIAATIAGAISFLGWMFMFGGDRDVNPLVAIGFMILAPVAAGIIQMSISRSREFVADHDGAKIAGTPNGLISALRKLESANHQFPMQGAMPSSNHMFIIHPFSGGQSLAKLFMSHPPTEERIAKLREMA